MFERLSARLRARNAAVIMVTNDPSLPRRCDRTILMGKVGSSASCSTIVDFGSLDELIARGHDIRSISVTESDNSESTDEDIRAENEGRLDGKIRDKHASLKTDQTKLMKFNEDSIGRCVDNRPSNGTISSCHADPESPWSVETCPIEIVDHTEFAEETAETGSIFVVEGPRIVDVCNNNNTVLSSPKPEAIGHVEKDQSSDQPSASSVTQPKKLMSVDESMTTGAVPFATYVSYLKAVKKPILIAASLLSFLTVNGAQLFQQYTAAQWSDVARGGAMSAALGARYMRSLVAAAGVVSVFLWLRSFLVMKVGVRASESLHSRMLSSVFAAPLSFFDSTDSGQVRPIESC